MNEVYPRVGEGYSHLELTLKRGRRILSYWECYPFQRRITIDCDAIFISQLHPKMKGTRCILQLCVETEFLRAVVLRFSDWKSKRVDWSFEREGQAVHIW